MAKYLQRAGYAFECHSTARDALALAERPDPDVVTAEYPLPGANGLILIEELILMPSGVVARVLSEYDYQDVPKEVLHVELRSFGKKAFDLVELEAVLPSVRSKAKLKPVVDFQGKLKTELQRITGSTSNRELSEVSVSKFMPVSCGVCGFELRF